MRGNFPVFKQGSGSVTLAAGLGPVPNPAPSLRRRPSAPVGRGRWRRSRRTIRKFRDSGTDAW